MAPFVQLLLPQPESNCWLCVYIHNGMSLVRLMPERQCRLCCFCCCLIKDAQARFFTVFSASLLFHHHHHHSHGVFRCAGFWTTSGCIIYCQALQHEQKQSGQPVLQRGGGGLHLHSLKTLPEFEAHRLRSSGNRLVCIHSCSLSAFNEQLSDLPAFVMRSQCTEIGTLVWFPYGPWMQLHSNLKSSPGPRDWTGT